MTSGDLMNWKKEWQDVSHIMVWGYGKSCKQHINDLERDYAVDAIIDKDPSKTGTLAEGHIPIILPDFERFRNKKIVISTHYDEIRRQLLDAGMKEYMDFCDIRVPVSAGAWYKRQEIVLSEVHIAVTTGCTLNCRYCNMYIPFHKSHVETLPIERLKEQLELLFRHVDRVVSLVYIGGETLLYRDLADAVKYTGERFRERIGNIEIVTNGTIVPEPGLLDALRRADVRVIMSNYRLNDEYLAKFEKAENAFLDSRIRVLANPDLEWKHFSFPYENLNLSDELAYENMDLCNPVFRGFNDSKFYFCHLSWSADKAGLHKEQSTDYIDFTKLKEGEREKIMRTAVCCHDGDYVSLCKKCGGCSSRNQRVIPAGEQA